MKKVKEILKEVLREEYPYLVVYDMNTIIDMTIKDLKNIIKKVLKNNQER